MFRYAARIASVVSFSPRLNRLVASWMLPALLLFSSDDFFPFRSRLSCILAYLFFQRFRWALDSGSDAVKLLLLCRDLTLSTFGVPSIALVGPIQSTPEYEGSTLPTTGGILIARIGPTLRITVFRLHVVDHRVPAESP